MNSYVSLPTFLIVSGGIGSLITYCIKKNIHIKLFSKSIDYYIDMKYYLKTLSNNESDKTPINNYDSISYNLIKKSEYNFADNGNYIYWFHNTEPKDDIIKKSLSNNYKNHGFEIIHGLEHIENPDLFLTTINKFAGESCNFNGKIPSIFIINLYEPNIKINNTPKIIIQNENYEEFILPYT
jgi:hypothetical protein